MKPKEKDALPGSEKGQRHRRLRKSIKLDRVQPYDLLKRGQIFACEQCSHYSPSLQKCTMGFDPQFTREKQMKLYELTGFMAFCRFLEID